ncbi:MAG: ATP-binding cassette domain-containing protein [Candidatus Bathyarchaeota archaeon]|nr:ATP-binding cassette domain-containing protein [Candidatus Bathyarchaeota archaeon]
MLVLEEVISAEGLVKRYGDLTALDGVSFSVPRGCVFGLLGPNGAGKSTTIRILTGLTRPTSGKATVLGHDAEAVEAKARIGVVPEASNVYEEMTALDNLVFAGELYGVPRDERRSRAMELLELFNLSDRARDVVVGLSRGMKRRLTIACALVHRPELIFLDEPTTGLDIQSARILREQVRELNKGGVTVLLTTHYLEEADQLCDSIAMINRGRIVALDTPENLKARVTGSRIVEVAFSGGVDEADLGGLPGVTEVHRLGDKHRLTVGDDSDIVGEIADYARSRGVTVSTINTLRPSLEDAFLKITGVNPEEAKKDKEPQRQRRNDG